MLTYLENSRLRTQDGPATYFLLEWLGTIGWHPLPSSRRLPQQPPYCRPGPKARRACGRSQVLFSGGPAGDVLVVRRRVVTDPGHVEDVDREEGELADDGLPAELGAHPGGVALLHLSVVDNAGRTA